MMSLNESTKSNPDTQEVRLLDASHLDEKTSSTSSTAPIHSTDNPPVPPYASSSTSTTGAPITPPHTPTWPTLKSTHLVFFKIADYIDLTLDNGVKRNVFFIFRSFEAFSDFILACVILVAQVMVLSALVSEATRACVDDNQPRYIWMGVILCALHTANSLTSSFLKALPYEVFGTTPGGAERLIRQVNESKIEKKDLFSGELYSDAPEENSADSSASADKAHTQPSSADLEAAFQSSSTEERKSNAAWLMTQAKVYSTAAVSTVYLYGVAAVLQLNNFLLLLAFGAILGTSTNFTDLVTHFISIETITHVHELVPRALNLKDRSPHSYNKSGVELEAELEASGRLPYGQIVPPGPNGKGGVYRRSARMLKNTIFWSFFLIVFVLFASVSESCRAHREVYG